MLAAESLRLKSSSVFTGREVFIFILSLLIYIPLQIAFILFAILGGMLVAYRQMVVSKKLGISQTAIEIIKAR
mgnify:FL=1